MIKEQKDNSKLLITPAKKGPLASDEIDIGYFKDLDMWTEKSTAKVLEKAEKTLDSILENNPDACKNRIVKVTTIPVIKKNERIVTAKGKSLMIAVFGRGYGGYKEGGFYKVYSPRGRPAKSVVSYRIVDVMPPHRRPLKKFLILRSSRDMKECQKNIEILKKFDFIALCDFGREFVYVT